MEAEYHNPNQPKTLNTRRYRGISYTSPINAAKEAVPVIDLADRLIGPGGMRRIGKEWAGRCPLPDHPDRSPSFAVNPQKNLWWCFGCLRGSDVVELYRLYHGYDQREAHTAAAMLLMEFGHEPPARPATWHRKQERQKPARDGLEQVKVRSVQRRLMRIFGDYIAAIEDPKERREEAEQMWRDLDVIACLIVKGRRR
jgi:DNA primase